MNIYLVKRPDEKVQWDEYDGFVCIADSEQTARLMGPVNPELISCERAWISPEKRSDDPMITVTLIGVAAPGETERVVLASFNAGWRKSVINSA